MKNGSRKNGSKKCVCGTKMTKVLDNVNNGKYVNFCPKCEQLKKN